MQNFSNAQCSECQLPPKYHGINSKGWRRGSDGRAVQTSKPPHGFKSGRLSPR